ncbi:hypothetical protein OIU79_025465 [Salix purpurea]|uniref:Uncharacterized protein n=1 Tax=Salix purpurea TaxID=77065 RepID=A0A9Q1A7E4_SALPP|nr:hypothetical protein OIU79_025465 [Salix purpurea]
MSGNTSHETSWADQWDYNPDPAVYHDKNSGRDNSTAYKQKVGEGFGKTKQAASTGIKKVKGRNLCWLQLDQRQVSEDYPETLGHLSAALCLLF